MKCPGVVTSLDHGFTLVEMLTAIGALVIVLGLMAALARHVRERSAEALTGEVLAALERALAPYQGEENADIRAALSAVPDLVSEGPQTPEEVLRHNAQANSRAFVRIWQEQTGGSGLSALPLAVYDRVGLRDAWGQPLVFMRSGAPNLSIAPQQRWFFVSAGKDRKYHTESDNLYSYERRWGRPAGHRE